MSNIQNDALKAHMMLEVWKMIGLWLELSCKSFNFEAHTSQVLRVFLFSFPTKNWMIV